MALLLWSACANVSPPHGGPKDKAAPKLLNRSTVDSLLNFKGGELILEFDEYVKLEGLQNSFQMSPLTKQTPKIKVKKKTIVIELPDSLLQQNTTYHLDFGGAIKDIRENNKVSELSITFSTGTYFDSLSMYGNVLDAATGQRDSGLVLLYPQVVPDSQLFKQRPMYVTKVKNGKFSFEGLPNKTFKIVALTDKNSNYLYDAIGERIAFRDGMIAAAQSDSGLVLYSFMEDGMRDTSSSKSSKKRRTQPSGGLSYKLEPNVKKIKTVDYRDSLKIILGNVRAKINTEKLRFYENDILDLSMTTNYDDSLGIVYLYPHWTMGTNYKLVIQKGFIMDTSGNALPADTLEFTTMKKADFSTLKVKVDTALRQEGAVLYLYKGGKEIMSSAVIDQEMAFKLLKPGSYKLRLLYDENRNGKWDAGSLQERRQPERTIEMPKKVRLKANWENKIEWKKNSKKKRLQK